MSNQWSITIDKLPSIWITNPNASSSSYCYYSYASYSSSLTILDGEYRWIGRSYFVIVMGSRVKWDMHVLNILQSKIMDGSSAILAIVAGKMAISHAAPYAEKGIE